LRSGKKLQSRQTEKMYEVRVTSQAKRALDKLSRRMGMADFVRVQTVLLKLGERLHLPGGIKLKAREDPYRLRISDSRILYQAREKESVILIVKIVRRSESTCDF